MTPQPIQGRGTRCVLLLLILVAGAFLAGPACASSPDDGDSPRAIADSVLASAATGNGSGSQLSTALIDWLEQHQAPALLATTGPEARMYVYVSLLPGTSTSVLDPILSGIVDRDEPSCLVTARVTAGELAALSGMPAVRQVREVDRPVVASGTTTTAGDTVLRTNLLRTQYGITGSGVRIGVISDGVESLAQARATGDVPSTVHVLSNEQGGDEGTAMLEIVHDIAPNASLVFHDCGWNVLEFNQAIDALVNDGCRIIVDDIGWIDEPFFEDGVVAAHAAEVASSRGVVYISAAGNDAGLHYQGLFRDDGSGRGWHNFSNGTIPSRNRLYVDLPPGDSVTVILQWAEPFGHASSNYDLALYNVADLSVPLAAGSRVQDGNDDPIEVLTWVNAGATAVQAEIDVSKQNITPARTLELFVYPRGGASLLATNTDPADSVYGHPAANGVIAVAAIDATDATGGRIEPYSSRGPVTIIAPLAASRQKPDCSGVDGVQVTGAGSFPTGFWGTSAAAPHVAGLAALIWSGRQDASGAQVRSALLATADDLGIAGTDMIFGAGRLNATAMYALFSPAARQPASLPARIEAEDYDTGGEGVAYHDIEPANLGGVYRPTEGVDIESLPNSAGYNVGWIRAGEWLRYTVNVSATGAYTLRVRGASRWGEPSLSLLVDGLPAATVPIAATNSYDVFDITNATVNLTAGEHQLRLLLSGYFNLDYIEFEALHIVLRVPSAVAEPQDLDGNGRYEDVNGNGRRDFADVVLYFDQLNWIAANEPVSAFDHNANGRCDFGDITALFVTL